jgi:hypothetical protein
VTDVETHGAAANIQFLEFIPGPRIAALGAVIHFLRQPAVTARETKKKGASLLIQSRFIQVYQRLPGASGAGTGMFPDAQDVHVFAAIRFIAAGTAGNIATPNLQLS